MTEDAGQGSRLKQLRLLLWAVVGIALIAVAALMMTGRDTRPSQSTSAGSRFGGPFTLTGGDGKPFSSSALAGKPYMMFFGFTRCGDVCPTTLARLTRLREQAGGASAMNIVFITIDPEHDGPKEVGQYAELFNSPIIGLTGTKAQIDAVKKQYGIYAEPMAHGAAGQEVAHTGTVLLFDGSGSMTGTITPDEPDTSALAKLKALSTRHG